MAASKMQRAVRDRATELTVMEGIAHVSFPGGGMFLPARSPYDRQILIEHIAARARANQPVQVLVDDLRWMVYVRSGRARAHCAACGCLLHSACYATALHDEGYCLACAFRDHQAQRSIRVSRTENSSSCVR